MRVYKGSERYASIYIVLYKKSILFSFDRVKETESTDTEADNDNGNDENDNEHDNDNDNVFRSGSESPGFHMVQLPVFEETKQRRATVSGGEIFSFSFFFL